MEGSGSANGIKWVKWVWLALLLLLICPIWLLFHVGLWVGALLMLIAVAVAVFLALPDSSRDWFVGRAAILITLPITVALFVGLLFWFIATYHWAAADQLATTSTEVYTIQDGPQTHTLTATLTLPATALLDGPFISPRLNLRIDEPISIPITARLELPDGLRAAASGPLLRQGLRPTTRGLFVPLPAYINSGQRQGFRPRQDVTLWLEGPGLDAHRSVRVPIAVEGQQGFAWRRFINTTVDPSSPLLLLLLPAVPAVAAFVQRQLETASNNIRERQQTKHKEALEDFSRAVVGREWTNVPALRNKIHEAQRDGHLPTTDLDNADALIALYNFGQAPGGSLSPETRVRLRRIAEEQPVLFGQAYLSALNGLIAAFDTASDPSKDELTELGAWVRYADLDAPLATELDAAHTMVAGQAEYYRQARDYPVCHQPPLSAFQSKLAYQSDDARDPGEADFLRTIGFWEMLDLFNVQLQKKDRSWLIHGPEGCGRSAAALMLRERGPNHVLTAQLLPHGEPGKQHFALAQELLRFISAHPTHLAGLGINRRPLLADYFAGTIGPESAAAHLTRQAAELPLASSLKDPAQREDARRWLYELASLIGKKRDFSPSPPDHALWPEGLLDVIGLLGFNRIAFVYDANAGDKDWLQSFINNELAAWRAARASLILFAPTSLARSLTIDGNVMTERELTWIPDDLYKLAVHRHDSDHNKIYEVFTDEDLTHLVAVIGQGVLATPRRLIRLWRLARQEQPTGTISRDVINRAALRL